MLLKYRAKVFFFLFSNFEIVMVIAKVKMDDLTKFGKEVYCKFQLNSYDCVKNGTGLPRFYFDVKMQDCRTSIDGGCLYNYNSYRTLGGCHNDCTVPGVSDRIPSNMTANVFCRLQPDYGKCHGYKPIRSICPVYKKTYATTACLLLCMVKKFI